MSVRFLLDTNVPSEMLAARPDAKVSSWVKAQAKETLFLSAVTMGELRKGIELLVPYSARQRQLEESIAPLIRFWFAGRILPVTQEIAERWGSFEAQRQKAGMPLGAPDGIIAATAFHLVTRNVKDFESLGVQIFNPWTD